ncbi:Cyclin pch1 [Cladobotryum mycophilum]|uniref:RNA polymerase II holoenzyme cyclin-like subunit n=1 Tax=Cladobotryum mycophilum TaxID=491253 RepID=A0ABR0SEK2_9HYPO
MASIDRYRPPREGYQPPLPGASRHERPSRSPPRRREVPPAAPTPPQHSARTSPPRPQASQKSPSQSGGQTPLTVPNQWFFTTDEVQSTPTIIDGVVPSEERLRRAKGVNFIYQAGVMLDLPQITLWVAGVFFHRFFMRFSMNIAATALFLANKVEENCRKTKDIIIAVARVAQKNAKLAIDEQSKEYWRWRDSILTYEEVMLEQLTFDLMIDNPYRHLFELLGQLDMVHNKNLRQAAWAFCNDACLTALPLHIEARDVAISSIFFASVHTNQQIDDFNGQAWWKYLKGNEDRCTKAIEVMRQFYTENPLRKQNPSLPSPAFHLENTRRRGDDSQSFHPSPMDLDRGSPASRVNGGSDKNADGTSLSVPGDGDYAPRSPSKRKGADTDASAGSDREEKRAKLSEDEGELVED